MTSVTLTWRNVYGFTDAPERVHDGHPVTLTAPLAPLDDAEPDVLGTVVRCLEPACDSAEFTAFADELVDKDQGG